jgi:hypothetical protein
MSTRSNASELASLEGLILSYHRDLIGCRNKHVKDRINREIARLQARKAALLENSSPVTRHSSLPQ